MLCGITRIPGYIEDVGKWMIALAKQNSDGAMVECSYGGVMLYARRETTILDIRRQFDRGCLRMRSYRQPRARLVHSA